MSPLPLPPRLFFAVGFVDEVEEDAFSAVEEEEEAPPPPSVVVVVPALAAREALVEAGRLELCFFGVSECLEEKGEKGV